MSGLDKLVAASRGHSRARGAPRYRRVVMRLDPAMLARVDALMPRWPDAKRAGVLRAFCMLGLMEAEKHAAPPAGEAAP